MDGFNKPAFVQINGQPEHQIQASDQLAPQAQNIDHPASHSQTIDQPEPQNQINVELPQSHSRHHSPPQAQVSDQPEQHAQVSDQPASQTKTSDQQAPQAQVSDQPASQTKTSDQQATQAQDSDQPSQQKNSYQQAPQAQVSDQPSQQENSDQQAPQAQVSDQPSQQENSDQPSQQKTCDQPSQHKTCDQPSKHKTCDQPSQQENSDQRSQQETSDQPSQQENNDQQAQQETSDQPSQHKTCDQPSQHKTCDQPSQHKTCDQPSQQETSDQPSQQVNSDQQAQQETSDQPSQHKTCDQPSQQENSDQQANQVNKQMFNILIIGRSGNGKTSIANSLADCVGIQPPNNKNSNTFVVIERYDEIQRCNIVHYDNDYFRIFDCSLIGDGDEKNTRIFVEGVLKNFEESGGFALIIFVLKYGVRFTKQEKDAVTRIKKIFGNKIFEELVVIAFSYGDLFRLDFPADESHTFKDWCSQQTGDIQKLFEEVQYRCVLFDNRRRDSKEQKSNCRHLLQYVECLDKEKLKIFDDVLAPTPKVEQLIRKKFTVKDMQLQKEQLAMGTQGAVKLSKPDRKETGWMTSVFKTIAKPFGNVSSQIKKKVISKFVHVDETNY